MGREVGLALIRYHRYDVSQDCASLFVVLFNYFSTPRLSLSLFFSFPLYHPLKNLLVLYTFRSERACPYVRLGCAFLFQQDSRSREMIHRLRRVQKIKNTIYEIIMKQECNSHRQRPIFVSSLSHLLFLFFTYFSNVFSLAGSRFPSIPSYCTLTLSLSLSKIIINNWKDSSAAAIRKMCDRKKQSESR